MENVLKPFIDNRYYAVKTELVSDSIGRVTDYFIADSTDFLVRRIIMPVRDSIEDQIIKDITRN